MKKLPDLVIGDLKINPPIIQGGMGVRVSKFNLVSAVSNTGALGVLSSVGLGNESESEIDYEKSSADALKEQIIKAKELTNNPIGVNIMYALTNYDSMVKVCVKYGVEVIFTGAGLPLKLPGIVGESSIKLVPIVSSSRAAEIITNAWIKRYNRLPDAFVVEGPLAGGHVGFSYSEAMGIEKVLLEDRLKEVIELVRSYDKTRNKQIPVIAAGGIFTGADIARMFKLGASGVQMSTRFVCTNECDVAQEYKEAYLKCKIEDIAIILSPAGMPARVIKNKFVERIQAGEKMKFKCPYKCLKTCDPYSANYCIAQVLVNSSKGNFDEGFAMCGQNAYRVKQIVPVEELIEELVKETLDALVNQ